MNRILIASALLAGLSGAAFAQEAPVVIGDYSAPVLQELNNSQAPVMIDRGMTASVEADAGYTADANGLSNLSIPAMYNGR